MSFETVPWVSRAEPGSASRAKIRQHAGPYQAAVLPQIAEVELSISSELLAAAEESATEIARFDADMGGEIAPFATLLLRSESAASSQIENLTASARAIAEAEIGASARPNAAEIVANGRAMSTALERAGDLDAEAILAMHLALMGTVDPDQAGRWRDQQVWIGGSFLGPHRAMFVPPQHIRVQEAIDDLIAFMRRDDLPVLPQAAIAHAQFESIHPFTDGNGRTGRALLHALLKNKALTRSATVPISAGLLQDTDSYFAALDAYRGGGPGAIVERTTSAVFAALTNGRILVHDLREIRKSWQQTVPAREGALTWRIADLLLRHPVVNAAVLSSELDVAASNLYRALKPLEESGVLLVLSDRQRNRVWRAPQILEAADSFAARAGRRSGPGG